MFHQDTIMNKKNNENKNKLTQEKQNDIINETLYELNNGDDELLKLVAKMHKDINNNTLLMYACDLELKDLALRIIKLKLVDVWEISKFKYTALIVACRKKLTGVALEIIKNAVVGGENNNNGIDYVDSLGETALICACQNNMPTVAKRIIELRPGSNMIGNIAKNGSTALIWACSNRMTKVINMLLKTNKSKPEQQNDLGFTALMWCCENKLEDVATNLIKNYNCSVGAIDKVYGHTALILACHNKLKKVLKCFSPLFFGDWNPLHVNKNGSTALIKACYNNLKKIIEIIINFNVPEEKKVMLNFINQKNSFGFDAISYAKQHTNSYIYRYLLYAKLYFSANYPILIFDKIMRYSDIT